MNRTNLAQEAKIKTLQPSQPSPILRVRNLLADPASNPAFRIKRRQEIRPGQADLEIQISQAAQGVERPDHRRGEDFHLRPDADVEVHAPDTGHVRGIDAREVADHEPGAGKVELYMLVEQGAAHHVDVELAADLRQARVHPDGDAAPVRRPELGQDFVGGDAAVGIGQGELVDAVPDLDGEVQERACLLLDAERAVSGLRFRISVLGRMYIYIYRKAVDLIRAQGMKYGI